MSRAITFTLLYQNVCSKLFSSTGKFNKSIIFVSRHYQKKSSEKIIRTKQLLYFSTGKTLFCLYSVLSVSHRYFISFKANCASEKTEKHCSNSSNVKESAWKLKKLFKCYIKEAESFIKENKHLSVLSTDDVEDRCKNCLKNNIPSSFILKNGWILSLTKEELNKKLKLLERWCFLDINSGLPLLKISEKELFSYTNRISDEASMEPELKDSNRLTYLAKIMQKDEMAIAELAVRRSFILKTEFAKMKNMVLTVLSYGMSSKYLFNDMWIIKYNVEDIKKRLDVLSTSVEPNELRPWMLRCKKSVFKRTIELRDENRTALEPFTNSEEYLCNRLHVSADVIEILKQKHPPLCKVQVHKLKEILDFIFSEGFTSAQVCRAPRLLCHSLSTLQERLRILHGVGFRPNSLMTLCITQKKFKEFIGKLESTQKFKKNIN